MGKPTICIGENKGAEQLRGNREADQRLLCACTVWFVSDLFGNHIVGFPMRRLISVFVWYHGSSSSSHVYRKFLVNRKLAESWHLCHFKTLRRKSVRHSFCIFLMQFLFFIFFFFFFFFFFIFYFFFFFFFI